MKRIFVFSAAIAGMFASITAGNCSQYWAKTYGGSNTDLVYSMQPVSDGGYIMAGDTVSFDDNTWKPLTIRLDADGNILWSKLYGSTFRYHFAVVQQTSDGGYITGGYNHPATGNWDALILKLDSLGDVSWARSYSRSDHDHALAIDQTSDGGYIVGGDTDSDESTGKNALLFKLADDGAISWSKMFGGIRDDSAKCVQQTADGGYIVAIETNSFGTGNYDYDFWILRLNSDGEIIWQYIYGDAERDNVEVVQQTSDGGYIVAGDNYTAGTGYYDAWVLRLDSDGGILWQKKYVGTSADEIYSINQTADGGYIIAGSSRRGTNRETEDLLVLKIDFEGNVVWQKTYGGSDSDYNGDYGVSIHQLSEGGYVVAGCTPSFGAGEQDAWLLKLNETGETPNCAIGTDSNLIVSTSSVIGRTVIPDVQSPDIASTELVITSQDVTPQMSVICCYSSGGFDDDCDDILNEVDNCPQAYNPNQEDGDADETGNVCDNCPFIANPTQFDTDNDLFGDVCDNCPFILNPNQEDMDSDMIGDACDADLDGDGILNIEDNCPEIYNPNQQDIDGDDVGDICDASKGVVAADSGGFSGCMQTITHVLINPCDASIVALLDNFSSIVDLDNYLGLYVEIDGHDIGIECIIMGVDTLTPLLDPNEDDDEDGIVNLCDNCMSVMNADQTDSDEDERGDLCDNCSLDFNPDQKDNDQDLTGDKCDPDDDNDAIADVSDNCSFTVNLNQLDTLPPQGNGIGDACDCEGNFNCSIDQDVDGSDAALFKADFGRSTILGPCTGESPCNGDFNCDGDADGTDAALFKADFGRSAIQHPCPVCTLGVAWCSYQ